MGSPDEAQQYPLFFLSDLGSPCGEHRDVDGLIGGLGMALAHQKTVRVVSKICGKGLPHTKHSVSRTFRVEEFRVPEHTPSSRAECHHQLGISAVGTQKKHRKTYVYRD